MLPAIGAAAAALDAIQSLTSPPKASSSQPIGFGPALPEASDSPAAPSSEASAVGGFSSPHISPGNISALLDAQSLASVDFAQALGTGHSKSDSSQSASASSNASSAYNSIDQLVQSTAVPLGAAPFSVSV